ncbi:MAG: histidine phosphatase family protein [Clostridia bacterium]|nr:histidine phosphatase family protein [Clostridia bacterium]
MTRIIAVRHAQSEGNLANFCCGHTDVALTPLGHLQAAETARYIAARYQIDRIYSSDLIRVMMTARPTAEALGMEIIPTRDLREIDVGDWDGLPHSEVDRCWVDERHLWHSDFVNAYCPGGESVRGLFARIRETFRRLADENPGQTVALFTHATPVRSMLTEWHGQPIEAINNTPWPGNASVTVIDYHDDGSYTIVEEAYDAHLAEAGLIDAKAAAYEKADAKEEKKDAV